MRFAGDRADPGDTLPWTSKPIAPLTFCTCVREQQSIRPNQNDVPEQSSSTFPSPTSYGGILISKILSAANQDWKPGYFLDVQY